MGSHHQLLAIFAALLLIMHGGGGVRGESKVIISNISGSDLWLNCKTNHRNLGTHILRDQQEISWSFHASIWEITRYHCWFQWVDNSGHQYNQDFAVWVFGIPVVANVYCGQCLWKVNNNGFSVWNKASQSFYHAYNWNTISNNVFSPAVAPVVRESDAT